MKFSKIGWDCGSATGISYVSSSTTEDTYNCGAYKNVGLSIHCWLFFHNDVVAYVGITHAYYYSGFQMTVEKPKPKQLLRPITTGEDSAMNQSQLLAITCNSLEAPEESRVHGAIGFGFDSHWLKANH